MTETNKNTCYVYKNDLKFNDFDITSSEFESEGTKQMYQNYKSRPKIELRIKCISFYEHCSRYRQHKN